MKRKGAVSITSLKNGEQEIYSDKEKADLIANHFESSHRITQRIKRLTVDKNVAKCLKNIERMTIESSQINLVNTQEVRSHIKNLKNSKAPGFDNFSNILLKNIPISAIGNIAKIFSACLKIGYFPDFFKRATIIAIPKPGKDPRNPSSYRPISLLSSLDKIFEKIILSIDLVNT